MRLKKHLMEIFVAALAIGRSWMEHKVSLARHVEEHEQMKGLLARRRIAQEIVVNS
jgi:hypothetical protein